MAPIACVAFPLQLEHESIKISLDVFKVLHSLLVSETIAEERQNLQWGGKAEDF